MSTNIRRNPVSTLFKTVQNTAATVSRAVQNTANTVAKNAKKTATTVGKNAQKTASTVSKGVQKTANQVASKTKAVANAANDHVKHVRAETKKATQESGWQNWNSKFEAKDGKVEIGGSKGFGSKMDEAPTLKSKSSSRWVDAPEAKTVKEKAKATGKEVLNSVGVKVFDPEKAKFEKDWDATSIKTKRVDSKAVDSKGYDHGYRVLSAYADGKGNITIGKSTNIEGKIEAGAVLAQGTIEGKTKLGKHVDLTGKAEATVGVTGSASGSVRVDLFSKKPTVKVKVGLDAFAGAKASVEGRVGNDYAGVGGKAEGWAGIGVKAKADVGIEGGKFKAKVELGAALGIGGSLSFSVDVNYQKGIDAVVGTGKKAVDNIKAAGSAVINAGSNLANKASNAVSSGWSAVKSWF